MFKFRLDVAGIVAIVGTDKSIAEVPGVFGKKIVADDESHCPEIFDRKDRCGAGVTLPEGMDLPDAGNKLGKVPDHFVVIEVLVAELFFYIEIVLQSPLDFRKTHIEDRFTTQHPFFFGNVAVPESSCELSGVCRFCLKCQGVSADKTCAERNPSAFTVLTRMSSEPE